MRIRIERTGDVIEREWAGSAKGLLVELGIPVETVLIVKDGMLVAEDEPLDDARNIELLSVISGG